MNRHQRRAVATALRQGKKIAYPEALGCPVCGKHFVAPPQHTADTHYRGSVILLPLDAPCAALWKSNAEGALKDAVPRLQEWLAGGSPFVKHL